MKGKKAAQVQTSPVNQASLIDFLPQVNAMGDSFYKSKTAKPPTPATASNMKTATI